MEQLFVPKRPCKPFQMKSLSLATLLQGTVLAYDQKGRPKKGEQPTTSVGVHLCAHLPIRNQEKCDPAASKDLDYVFQILFRKYKFNHHILGMVVPVNRY